MWQALIKPAASILGGWIQSRQEVAKAKTDAEVAVIKAEADIKVAHAISAMSRAEKGQEQNYDLDKLAMENMAKSWKDELILIVFLTPMFMAFIPGMGVYALAGFAVIASTPVWYQYIVIGMVVVIYGLRGLLEKVIDKKIGMK
jgi:hypothetical protein